MLYVIYGTDSAKTSAQAKKIVDALAKKKPDASVFILSDDNVSLGVLDEYLGAVGLFEAKHIVRLENLLTHKEVGDDVIERLPLMHESEHIFVIRDGALLAPIKKKIEKYADEVRVYDVEKKEKEEFKVFALTDAVGMRDKKKAWMLYREALRRGGAPEELHGIIWWQVKMMLQVASGDTSTLKSFPANKARGFLKNYPNDDLNTLARRLITLYHDARRGIVEFEVGMEKLLLSL